MKIKNFIVLAGLVVMLAGCANDQYAIEKQFWQVQKLSQKIFGNPNATPPNELERAVDLLNKFVQKNPQSNLTLICEFNIPHLYIAKKEYDKARAQLGILKNKYSKTESACAEAVFLIGNTYELQDKWNLALVQYEKVMQGYPLTLRGLVIPMHIARYYKTKHQPDKMISAYKEAINHYKTLADKNPDPVLAFTAYNQAARCYIELQDWQNTINTFNAMIGNYKGKVNLEEVLVEMAYIYSRELKDNVKAKETLARLIKDYPRSKLINAAETLLKQIDKK